MDILLEYDIFPFLAVLTALVFIHELGHYLVARWNGVRVEVFSIGFGPKLFGWVGKQSGTHWRISAIPLGGYVKMFGDTNPASVKMGDAGALSVEEQKEAFFAKPLRQRAAVVAAGPIANFLFAIFIMTCLFMFIGKVATPTRIGEVMPDSAAKAAGLLPGDEIMVINDRKMRDFATIQRLVSRSPGKELDVTIRRNDALQHITLVPAIKEMTDNFGKVHQFGQIGIKAKQGDLVKHNPVSAMKEAVLTSWQMCGDMLRSLKEIVLGIRSFKEMGGPVKIAQLSGEVAESRNIGHFFFFVAILSLNLGLVNLFPVPALDGGHLLYYAAEGLRGKPLSPKLQEAGAYMGVAMIAMLVVAITWNDVRSVFFSG